MLIRQEFSIVGYKAELKTKTALVDIRQLPSVEEGREAYRSVFVFRAQDLEGRESLKDIADSVPIYAEFLPIDLDNEDNLESAWEDAKAVVNDLDVKKVPYHLFFSGRKGFHILIPTESFAFQPTTDSDILKRMALSIAGDKASFDPSVYNKSRVFRIPYSFNVAGGYYKVPCQKDEELTTILDRARGQQTPLETTFRCEVVLPMLSVYNEAKTATNRVLQEHTADWHNSVFIQVGKGGRNEAAYTMARRLARRGIVESDAIDILSNIWNSKYVDPPLDLVELAKVVKNAYTKGVNTFDDEKHIKEISFSQRDVLEDTISDLQRPDSANFKTGFVDLDKFTMGFEAQESIIIAARSGNFKSSLLARLLQQGSKLRGKPALFFSMEMGRRTLVPRLIQMSEKVNKRTALDALRSASGSDVFTRTMQDFGNVKFIFKSGLTIESMLAIVDKHLEKYGELSAIGIDYLGMMRDVNNNTERTARAIQEIKSIIARTANCPVFTLVQAKQKYEGRGGDIELDRTCGKDSDSILDLGDYAIGMWRHWQVREGKEEYGLFGRFFKARGMDDEPFGDNPVFGIDVDAQHLDITNIHHVPNPPSFKQIGGDHE